MANKEVKAINKMIRTSSQKLNLIIKDIRRKDINSAVNILKFSNKRVSKEVLKTLNSAIANAENNNNLDIDKLFVKEAYVGKSLRMKRFRPMSKGRAFQIIKPFLKVDANIRGGSIMGQKVNPTSLRMGINKYWQSTWFEKKDYSNFLKEDYKIRNYIEKNYAIAGISSIIIERAAANLKIIIHTSKPGVLIGKKGADIEKLRSSLSKLSDKNISLDIKEIKKPETDASLLADSIARQLEKRIAFRKAMKRSGLSAIKLGAKGIKIVCGGRLGGAEIARTEKFSEGSVPLHTLRADIDYATARALTTYGIIGIKVWLFKGESKNTKNINAVEKKSNQ
jgi:small subunit ribosomal protein S3